MNILLTGATGHVGSAVLTRLVDEGHTVTAIVRSADKAALIEAAGGHALIGDLTDTAMLTAAAAASDGVIHTASPGDESSSDFDDAVVTAVLDALSGTDKPYVHTGGVWIFGAGSALTEGSTIDPPRLTAWRPAIERRVLAADGVRSVVIAPGIVYGEGKGIPRMLVDAPTSGDPAALHLVGAGDQHWTTVHVDDLAALYVLALEGAEAGSYYFGVSGQNPTVRELGIAASTGAGLGGEVVEETVGESGDRLGELFAEALLVDQQATGSKARIDLGWEPNGPSLVEELTTGSYAPQSGTSD